MDTNNETARQIFKRADNEEGFIAVIAHRSRDLPALQEQGWCLTAEETKQAKQEEQAKQPAALDVVDRAELEKQATELGIEFDGRTSDKKLKERIDEALAG